MVSDETKVVKVGPEPVEPVTVEEIHAATQIVLANPLLHRVFNWNAFAGFRAGQVSAPTDATQPQPTISEVERYALQAAVNVCGMHATGWTTETLKALLARLTGGGK